MSPSSSPLNSLTSLRFFAAFHVVLLHAYDQFATAAIWQLPNGALEFVKSGAVAVSVFFILSGFILAYNYLDHDFRNRHTIRSFWVARLARIYPVYVVGLLLAAPKFLSDSLTSASPINSVMTAGAALTLTQAWIPDFALAWNGPGWSLSAEAFFYLLFPAAAMVVSRVRNRGVLLLAMVACWIVALIPPALASALELPSSSWSQFFKFNPAIRLSEFLLGVCLGKFFLLQKAQGGVTPSRAATLLLVVVAMLVTALCHRSQWPKLMLHNGLLDPLFALLILSLAWLGAGANVFNRALSGRGLLLLGQASYALYILHIPIKGLLWAATKHFMPTALTDPFLSSLLFLVYVVLSVGVAVATFRLIEEPARRFIKERLAPSQTKPSTTAAEGATAEPAATSLSPVLPIP